MTTRRDRSPFGPWCSGLVLALLASACSEPAPPPSDDAPAAVDEAEVEPEPEPASTTADADTEDDDSPVDADGVPTEPAVTLTAPGRGEALTLPSRTAALPEQRVVVQVKITEGARKRLHLPIVRVAGDVVLDGVDDAGSRYRFTPRSTTVLAEGDGVDPEFLATFQGALAVGEAPTAVPLVTDRWDVVTELAWPATDDPHAAEVAAGLRSALSHLAVPIPSLELSLGATWQVHRRVELLSIPLWQLLECSAKKIEGNQLEVSCEARYLADPSRPITEGALGQATIAAIDGQGKLRARYDLRTALPVEMQLQGRLRTWAKEGAKPERFGFELRVDEDFLARPDPRVTLHGQVTEGALVHGVVAPGTKVWFNAKPVKVSPEGDFLFGFDRDAPPRALLSFAFPGGPTERHVLHVAARSFEPEAIDGLPTDMVDLEREVRRELTKSQARIKKLRNQSSDVAYFRDGFQWPMKGTVTSTYGRKRTLNGEDHGYHWGVDLAAPVGRKVKAPAGGVVLLSEKDVPLSGNLIILDHGHGLTSSFLHLDKLKVAVGDVVEKGQVIATSGNTGRSTGPHLDWRMNLFDTRIDPMTVVGPTP